MVRGSRILIIQLKAKSFGVCAGESEWRAQGTLFRR